MGRILFFLRMFRHDIIVMVLSVFHRDTPKKVRGLLLAAILYLISPIDIIPDTIPFFGVMDDAIIVPMAIETLLGMLPYHVRQYGEAKAGKVTRHMSAIVIGASVFVAVWMGLVLWGLYRLIF